LEIVNFDPRVTPARADLAAVHLQGKIAAPRYAEGRELMAARAIVPLRKSPASDASQETQLLHGERFTAYEEKDGWLWGQCGLDRYVGYARAASFVVCDEVPTHRIRSLSTPLLPAPDVKRAMLAMLPMNAKFAVLGTDDRFLRIAGGTYVFAAHAASLEITENDFVAVAERFLGTPYLWGGKTSSGIDCSGLVQTALEAAGIAAPRDTDMMEAQLGSPVDLSHLERGDLVFWKGHMGVMRDHALLLHANAFTMDVASENVSDVIARIAATGEIVRAVKRLAR
jgi:hypothetical protein